MSDIDFSAAWSTNLCNTTIYMLIRIPSISEVLSIQNSNDMHEAFTKSLRRVSATCKHCEICIYTILKNV